MTAFGTTGDAKHFGKTQFTFLGQTIDDFKELKKSMESLGYGKLDFGSAKSFGKTANGNISAFFKSIMQGSAETKEQLKKDTEAIQSYIDEFTNSQGKVSNEKFVDIMSDASSQAKLYVQQTDAAALSTDAFAESQTRLAKISNSVVGGLKDIGAAIASAGLTLIASAAINFVVKSIMSAIQHQEDLRQASLEAGSALDKQSAAINDYKTQISSLKESLDKGNLSEQESYDVRKQLISIQDELVEKYGDEAAGIDLVNGKYQEQLDILNGIADQKAKDYLNEHNESINTAQEKMLEELNMQPGGFFEVSDTQAEKLQEIAAKYAERGLSIFAGDSSLSNGTNLKDITFNIKANATDAKDVLNDFMTDVRNANDRTNFLGDDLFNTITNNLADGVATAQSVIDKWGSEAETAAKYQIQLSDTWSKTYNDLTEAQETYNDAVAKNDDKAIAAALKKVKAAQDEFANTDIDNSFVQQYMQTQADQLNNITKQSFAQQALNEGFSQAAQTYKECSKNLADLNDKYKQYGNISNTNRDVLKWNTENLKKYKDVIASWKWDVGVGDYSTVEGVSNSFGEGDNAVEIAYTPMLQTNSGLVPLSADTMDEYINILVEKATDGQTGKIDVDKLLALDAEGLYLKVNGVEQKISGMVAGVEGQIVNGAKLTAADVAAIAGSVEEELQKLFKQSSDYVGHSMHDVQDSVLRWKTLVEDENSFDPFKQFVESANLSEDKAEEVYKNIGLALDSIDKYGLQDIDILNIESLSKADHTLNNVTGDARKSIGAYLDLESAAEGLDIPLDTLIDTLVELGVVYSDNIKYTNEFTSSALTMATAASKAVSSVTSILNSQGTGVNVNADSYSELIKDNAEYAAALQYSNGTMQLNREMAQQLTEAKVKESEAYIKVAYSQNQVKYEKVKNDLSYYTDKQALMRDVLSEYMTTLSQCTDLTAEQRAELTQAMDDIVNSYSGGYDTIDKLIQGYNDTLIESGDMTNESYQQQLENLLEFADQNQASYDTIAEILNSNFEAVAENTDLTYWQRQSQITSLVDLANQYGVSSDDIINHLANIATQEQYAAESTDITHAAMMTTVQMACVEMGASYDSLRTKIESVTQAQQKMIEAIGKADFNTLMPMGTATSHGNKIQWGKPNFDPLQHATGVLNSPTTHIAITDEKGPEIKMRKPSAGNYSLIEKGTSVIPADASANIWKFGLDPESFIAAHMPQRSIKSVEITQPNTGNGVTVSVGDIQMYGVNDVESFGRVIHDRVSGIFAQEFSKR